MVRLGILGGGQLGKMLIQAASKWSVHTAVLDPDKDCPAAVLADEFTQGSFNDYEAVLGFGRGQDVITIEIENVNTEALEKLRSEGKTVHPSPEVIRMIKDKGRQKRFYLEHGIATAGFSMVAGREELKLCFAEGKIVFPAVQKLCTEGYDGRGVAVLRKAADLENALDGPSVVEDLVPIKKEISVVLSRNADGGIFYFPPVEMEFNSDANLIEMLIAPAGISKAESDAALKLAGKVIGSLGHVGVMAVEMFLTEKGEILVNESAPRPHNSGHHTIEACSVSQYDQHLRAVLGLPPVKPLQITKSVMVNILGTGKPGRAAYQYLDEALMTEGASVHLYGKKYSKPFRKMGHITICGSDMNDLMKKGRELKKVTASGENIVGK